MNYKNNIIAVIVLILLTLFAYVASGGDIYTGSGDLDMKRVRSDADNEFKNIKFDTQNNDIGINAGEGDLGSDVNVGNILDETIIFPIDCNDDNNGSKEPEKLNFKELLDTYMKEASDIIKHKKYILYTKDIIYTNIKFSDLPEWLKEKHKIDNIYTERSIIIDYDKPKNTKYIEYVQSVQNPKTINMIIHTEPDYKKYHREVADSIYIIDLLKHKKIPTIDISALNIGYITEVENIGEEPNKNKAKYIPFFTYEIVQDNFDSFDSSVPLDDKTGDDMDKLYEILHDKIPSANVYLKKVAVNNEIRLALNMLEFTSIDNRLRIRRIYERNLRKKLNIID